ncbi:MAG: hypothetical protein LAO20_19875 [Acidobacteriia bacterium]|nr:hypothetical protein [Terriglobia bacterium]
MKMTVVANKDGSLVAAALGHTPQPHPLEEPSLASGFRAGLLAGPGQQLHVIDVPEDILHVTAPAEIHSRLMAELRKSRK